MKSKEQFNNHFWHQIRNSDQLLKFRYDYGIIFTRNYPGNADREFHPEGREILSQMYFKLLEIMREE